MARTRKSLRKIQRLVFLMLITIVSGITATYAWFSSQRDVEVSGLKLNVEVTENMQISLDGEEWSQSITIGNMRQFYGTYTGTEAFRVYQAKAGDNTNYVPTELIPVSTVGEVANGKLQFMAGEATIGETGELSLTATPCSEEDLTSNATVETKEAENVSHPYLAFDIYLKNLSSKEEGDNLQLNVGSRIWVDEITPETQEGTGKLGTGLENCARVGFVTYKSTAEVTATGEEVRALIPDTSETNKATASIWEPNDLEHIQEVIKNSGRGVTANTTISTYGVKYSNTAVTIDDIESTTDAKLGLQTTMKPTYNETGTTTLQNITDIAGTEVILKPNKITKVRVYIWLEGQDVDCINTASTGDRLQATIRLTKPQNIDGGNNTYTGGNTYITAATLKTKDYGGYVTNYSASNGANVNWRIFHSDGKNIYLIADDYVDRSYVPAGKGGTEADKTNEESPRGFSIAPYVDYAGTADIATNLKERLLSKYTYTNTNPQAKATAYLLDIKQWSGFKDSNNYADYAIGGPTLELFTASYNKTHTDKTIDIEVSSITGYGVKWSTDTDYENTILGLSASESLYVINSKTNARGMWLASPSIRGGTYTLVIVARANSGPGVVSYAGCLANIIGARPVVSLKSNIKLEKQADGTYKIVP